MNCIPIVIIGAPRSGTNMLRDALAALPGAASWPCDEINYIWRHGNVRYPSDEFPAELATPTVAKYIRSQFTWVAQRASARYVIEKTCANSLRVGFVGRVVPEAKYIFLRRSGWDVVASAMKRWRAPLDLSYIMKKARFVPPGDLPVHVARYLSNRVSKILSRQRRLAYWGPILDDMEQLTETLSLEELCALQWRRCVEAAEDSFSRIDEGRIISVEYEDFVLEPHAELSRIVDFIGSRVSSKSIERALFHVSADKIGKGLEELDDEARARISRIIDAPRRHSVSRRADERAHPTASDNQAAR